MATWKKVVTESSAGEISQDTTGNSATATNVAYTGLTGTAPTWNQDTTGTAGALATSGGLAISGVVETSGKSTYTSGGDVSLATTMATNVIDAENLKGKSGALDDGTSGQFLTSLGDGTFAWASQTSANDKQMTISVSGNLSGGGSFTGNQSADSSVSISMSATPSFTSLSTTGNVTIGGDLQVSGATISTTTETLEIADNKMVLNSDLSASANAVNSGIVVQRGKSGDDALLFWDESDDAWHIGTEASGDITKATSSRIATQSVQSSFSSSDTSVPTGGLQYDTSTGNIYLRTA